MVRFSKKKRGGRKKNFDFIQQAERLVVIYTNRERRKRGLKPLKFNKKLYKAAKYWSRVQAKNKKLFHDDVISRVKKFGYSSGYVGENCAMVPLTRNPRRLAARFVKGWMNSPGHRANILKSEYNEIGVGIWVRGNVAYATQDFGCRPPLLIRIITDLPVYIIIAFVLLLILLSFL